MFGFSVSDNYGCEDIVMMNFFVVVESCVNVTKICFYVVKSLGQISGFVKRGLMCYNIIIINENSV